MEYSLKTSKYEYTIKFLGCFGVIATGIAVVGSMMNPLVILALLPVALLIQYFRRTISTKVLIRFEYRTIESQSSL